MRSALGTTRYRRDLLEVQRHGGVASEWTEHQSAIAWLAPGRQYSPALGALVRQPGLSLRWKIRLLAAYSTAAADAGIAVADAKRTYWHWRPVTAIRLPDTDGDPLTQPDPGWSSYLMTPANPEWPSGHGGGAGAAETVLERFTGPRTGGGPSVSPVGRGVRSGLDVASDSWSRPLLGLRSGALDRG